MPFSKLGLSPTLCSPLARKGYVTPTPVQTAAIPLVLSGADLVARAQTGTGKTAAFGLPAIDRLFARAPRAATRAPRALVLVPTRELALQVQVALTTYGAPLRLRVIDIVGGVSMVRQIQALRHGADIVVATPGRLIDHLQRRTIDLAAIEVLVLDEADRMLDMGFLPPLRRIAAALPRERQTLLFSATLTGDVERFSAEFTRQPKRVDVSSGEVVASTVTHHMHPVALDQKRALLVHVLRQTPSGQALVFCKTKRGADRVGDHLEREGLKVAVIHGNKSQNSRNRSVADFKSGGVAVLVATDIAARGLDIAQLPLVVNFDLPLVAEDYVHRVGRTGRAGLTGRAVSFVTASDGHLVRDIQRLLPAPVKQVAVDGFAHAAPRQHAAPARAVTSAVRDGASRRHQHHYHSRRPRRPQASAAPR
jgi:ATP-dependent RNA helicase RhlE